MAVAAALFAGYSAYNSQNSNELTDIALANVEALSGPENDKGFYVIQKYAICKMAKITAVDGDIAGEITVGALITSTALGELRVKFSGKIESKSVDCHWAKCLSTTEAQKIDCIEGNGWEECHSQCDHSNNQM